MIDTNNLNDLIGADVYGSDDQKIGSVGQVYVDADVPRQVVGRISSVSKVGVVGSARPRCTSSGRFQAIAS